MTRTLAALLLLTLAGIAQAQETYNVPAPAQNVTTLTAVITKRNGDLCATYQLARTCTQAQLCTAAGQGGCTAAQARTANLRIHALTQAGREEFTTYQIALPKFTEIVAEQQAENHRSFCSFWTAASQGAKDSACTAIGAGAGCDPVCN